MLTDHAPQTVFISGWAYDGQDTSFTSEDKINASLGTYEELRDSIETAKPLNANVTLNVNYDDAYKSSTIFNQAFIARRPDGKLWKSRAWDGEDSYIVGVYAPDGTGTSGRQRYWRLKSQSRLADKLRVHACATSTGTKLIVSTVISSS
jgi:hypothetical protein